MLKIAIVFPSTGEELIYTSFQTCSEQNPFSNYDPDAEFLCSIQFPSNTHFDFKATVEDLRHFDKGLIEVAFVNMYRKSQMGGIDRETRFKLNITLLTMKNLLNEFSLQEQVVLS